MNDTRIRLRLGRCCQAGAGADTGAPGGTARQRQAALEPAQELPQPAQEPAGAAVEGGVRPARVCKAALGSMGGGVGAAVGRCGRRTLLVEVQQVVAGRKLLTTFTEEAQAAAQVAGGGAAQTAQGAGGGGGSEGTSAGRRRRCSSRGGRRGWHGGSGGGAGKAIKGRATKNKK